MFEPKMLQVAAIIVLLFSGAGLGLAVWFREITILKATLVVFFEAMCCFFLVKFDAALPADERPGIESHWGGLGGGLGGWRISRSLLLLLGGLLSGILVVVVAANLPNPVPTAKTGQIAAQQEQTKSEQDESKPKAEKQEAAATPPPATPEQKK